MMQCVLSSVVETVEIDGMTFECIYGKHNGEWYVAIPVWGISAMLSSRPTDILYNQEQILKALLQSRYSHWLPLADKEQKRIARTLTEFLMHGFLAL